MEKKSRKWKYDLNVAHDGLQVHYFTTCREIIFLLIQMHLIWIDSNVQHNRYERIMLYFRKIQQYFVQLISDFDRSTWKRRKACISCWKEESNPSINVHFHIYHENISPLQMFYIDIRIIVVYRDFVFLHLHQLNEELVPVKNSVFVYVGMSDLFNCPSLQITFGG